MSYVTGITLHLSVMEDSDMDDPTSCGALVDRMNEWLKDWCHLPLARIDGEHSGEKHPQAHIFVAGFNGLRDNEFVELFASLPWKDAANAILVLNPEEGDVRIYRASTAQDVDAEYRIRDAAEALCRYGGRPYSEQFIEVLETLAELNDDMYHIRIQDLNRVNGDKIKALVDEIVRKAERNQR